MKIRLYNAKILTMEDDKEIFSGEVHTDGNIISYVGPGIDASGTIWDREIDCMGDLVMPGFKDAHTHSAMTFLRSYADDLPLQRWLEEKIFPMEARLLDGDVEVLSKVAILEYLTSGITSNFDMYVDNEAHARASISMGYRSVFCGELNDHTGSLEKIESEYKKLNDMDPLVSFRLGFHAEYTTSRDLLVGMSDIAHRYREPVYLHLAETKDEVDRCRTNTGMSPVRYLDALGMFDYGGGGFHGIWMDDEDISICSEKGISIVTNPCSNAKLASGIVDLVRLRERDIVLGIGTDGPASNNALDMFREMYLASVLQKLRANDPAAIQAYDILKMATVNGAMIMGLPQCSTLQKGNLADLICIDLHRPNMQPENDIINNLVYSASKDNIRMTMVDGRILYEDRQFFVGEDVDDIYKEANTITDRIKCDKEFSQR